MDDYRINSVRSMIDIAAFAGRLSDSRPPSGVPVTLETLDKRAAMLDEATRELADRLSAVLRPEPPASPSGVAHGIEPSSSLADRLRGVGFRLDEIHTTIRRIIDRLDV